MKQKVVVTVVGLLLALATIPASAKMAHRNAGFRSFSLGVCVGQTLAGAGIVAPVPLPKWKALTTAQKDQLKQAIKSCRAQVKAKKTTKNPAPAASPTPAK